MSYYSGLSDEDYANIDLEDNYNVYETLLKRRTFAFPGDLTDKSWVEAKVIILFETGDLEAVVNIVGRTLRHPISKSQVVSVVVHESLRDILLRKLHAQMELLEPNYYNHPNFLDTLSRIKRMSPRIVCLQEYDPWDILKMNPHMVHGSPIIVCDLPQIYFGDKPTGIVTVNTFRTINEAAKLVVREGIEFYMASIYTDKIANGYELVTRILQPKYFLFNCIDTSIDKIWTFCDPDETTALVRGPYHYETLFTAGGHKAIAFPISQLL